MLINNALSESLTLPSWNTMAQIRHHLNCLQTLWAQKLNCLSRVMHSSSWNNSFPHALIRYTKRYTKKYIARVALWLYLYDRKYTLKPWMLPNIKMTSQHNKGDNLSKTHNYTEYVSIKRALKCIKQKLTALKGKSTILVGKLTILSNWYTKYTKSARVKRCEHRNWSNWTNWHL